VILTNPTMVHLDPRKCDCNLMIYYCRLLRLRQRNSSRIQYNTNIQPVVVLGLSVWGAVRGHGFGLGAFNRNNYRFPTMNHTMQVFGSDA